MNSGYSKRPRGERKEVGNSAPFGRKGFTLIEMLVVMGVIAILLSLLIPGIEKAREQARQMGKLGNMRAIVDGVNRWAEDHRGKYPPAVAKLRNDDDNYPWRWAEPITMTTFPLLRELTHRAMSEIIKDPYIQDSKIMQCTFTPNPHPQMEAAWEAGDSWSSPDYQVPGLLTPHYSSFGFYWNYKGALIINGREYQPRLYEGPRSTSAKGMLVSCILLENSEWRCKGGMLSCQPFRESGSDGRKAGSSEFWWEYNGLLDIDLMDIHLDAGYTDGHVEKFLPSKDLYLRIMNSPTNPNDYLRRYGKWYLPWRALEK